MGYSFESRIEIVRKMYGKNIGMQENGYRKTQ